MSMSSIVFVFAFVCIVFPVADGLAVGVGDSVELIASWPFGSDKSSLTVSAKKSFSAQHVARRNGVSFDDNVVAYASFSDQTTQADGFGRLSIYTYTTCNVTGSGPNWQTTACNDEQQAYAAGFLEGQITTERIYHSVNNERASLSDNVWSFLRSNWAYTQQQAELRKYNDAYWWQVALLLQQFQGLADGFNASCAALNICQFVSYDDLLVVNFGLDLDDISAAVDGGTNNNTLAASGIVSSHNNPLYSGNGHCSVLIKVPSDRSDLLVSQITWSGFASMLRIMKHYDFQFRETSSADSAFLYGKAVSFSSYPGSLVSGDDFYTISPSNLVVIETTIGNSNPDLYAQYTKPTLGLAYWLRNTVANRLSNSGRDWANYFSLYSIGSYNNEFIVIDYKLFTPGSPTLSANTVWILDQIPGYIRSYDISSAMDERGYWPSYNAAYDQFIFNMSGSPAYVAKYGDFFTYSRTPRALIFQRDEGAVQDLDGMKKIMRYNDFTKDPLAYCDCQPYPYSGENAIAARSDLNAADGVYPFPALSKRPHGATDAKIATKATFQWNESTNGWTHEFHAQLGPTHDIQPVFSWNTAVFDPPVPHMGQFDTFDFDWGVIQFS